MLSRSWFGHAFEFGESFLEQLAVRHTDVHVTPRGLDDEPIMQLAVRPQRDVRGVGEDPRPSAPPAITMASILAAPAFTLRLHVSLGSAYRGGAH
jgi:hypothetical protein